MKFPAVQTPAPFRHFCIVVAPCSVVPESFGQSLHLDVPVRSWYLGMGQFLQAEFEDWPVWSEYLPPAQSVQDVWPDAGWYLPISQSVQEDPTLISDERLEYLPLVHGAHELGQLKGRISAEDDTDTAFLSSEEGVPKAGAQVSL